MTTTTQTTCVLQHKKTPFPHHIILYSLVFSLYVMFAVDFYLDQRIDNLPTLSSPGVDTSLPTPSPFTADTTITSTTPSRDMTTMTMKYSTMNEDAWYEKFILRREKQRKELALKQKQQEQEQESDETASQKRHSSSRSRSRRHHGPSEDHHGSSSGSFSSSSSSSNHHSRRQAPKEQETPSPASDPAVEFFPNPTTAQKEAKGYVWLTSYSRIPLPALQEYCFTAKNYCPPGNPGPRGDKGDIGESGPRGKKGDKGELGPTGPLGPQGMKGERGESGLDGRDGLDGQPGLDGIPGRDGINGENGMDGLAGQNGRDGRNGTDGTHGKDGSPGLRGPPGLTGSQGLPGPRGRKGVAGKPGNSVPPKMNEKEAQTTMIVQEGDNVKMPCIAEGIPEPKYSWRRSDQKPIKFAQWSNSAVEGSSLNITRIRREHFGSYICFANNGVPPPASHQVNLEVTFAPTIKVRQQMVGSTNASSVLLECNVEAFPPALAYWVQGENRMIENNWKYKMSQEDSGFYSSILRLNISYVEPSDYSMFKCVAKNERGKTFGLLTLYQIDPNRPRNNVQPGETSGQDNEYVVFGQPSIPPYEPCPACPDCPVLPRCPKGYNLYDAVRAIPVIGEHHNRSQWVPFKQRTKHCVLNQIGKPVYYRDSDSDWGSWMQDSHPKSADEESKFWMTTEGDPHSLLEFANKDAFRHKNVTRSYTLPFKFDGNGHVVHQGHFFYNQYGTNKLIKYDLSSNHTYFRTIEGAAHKPEPHPLYETSYNYMDIMADENGLWTVFASNNTNNTLILKFDPHTLGTENAWNITLDHQMIGEMFISCGVLYGIESATDTFTKIRFAFDLYLNTPVDVSVNFTNPFKHNNLIAYNPRHEKIYAWDDKNLIEYPIRFTESTDEKDDDKDDPEGTPEPKVP